MKRDLAQPFYDQVERGSPIFGWFIAFINEKSIPLIFMCKGTNVFMDLMADMFIVFLFLFMFVICTFYDNNYVWISTCFYLYVNG